MQAEKQEEVLEHFAQAIIEDGLEGASTGNVARRMGIKTSLLMHYFPNKSVMVEAVVQRMVASYEEKFLPSLSPIQDPVDRLHHIISTLVSPEWEIADSQRLFYTCFSLIFRDQEVKKQFQTLFDQFREFLVGELTAAMEQKAIPYQDPDDLANLIITIIEGKGFVHSVISDVSWSVRQQKILLKLLWSIIAGKIILTQTLDET